MQNTCPAGRTSRSVALAVVPAAAAVALASTALAQTYSASDSVFAPATWTLSLQGNNPAQTGSALLVNDGYAVGSNARLGTLNPNGNADSWAINIFEGFSYDPSSAPGFQGAVTLSFDSRWVSVSFSRVGPALRQGSTVWAGYHATGGAGGLNTTAWSTFTYSGWSVLTDGAGLPGPDFSAGAAPIYFGYYQRNGGSALRTSEFANFSVTVTVPAPGALPMLAAILAGCPGRGRRRAR